MCLHVIESGILYGVEVLELIEGNLNKEVIVKFANLLRSNFPLSKSLLTDMDYFLIKAGDWECPWVTCNGHVVVIGSSNKLGYYVAIGTDDPHSYFYDKVMGLYKLARGKYPPENEMNIHIFSSRLRTDGSNRNVRKVNKDDVWCTRRPGKDPGYVFMVWNPTTPIRMKGYFKIVKVRRYDSMHTLLQIVPSNSLNNYYVDVDDLCIGDGCAQQIVCERVR